MNQKTAKLMRKASQVAGASYDEAKEKWNGIPAYKRNEFRKRAQEVVDEAAPEASFHLRLLRWRVRNKLIQKEAAAILDVPFDTYRSWEYGANEPLTPDKHKPDMQEIERRMEAYNG